jgi:NitT/TauT family transport system substrate-binding protein
MRSFLKRFACLGALAGTSMLFASGVSAQAPKPLPGKEKVIVGIPAKLKQNAALHLAKALGEFDKENLDVEYSISKPSDSFVLLGAGKYDVVVSQPSAAFFNAVAAGTDIKYVAPIASLAPKNGFWVSKAFLNGRAYHPSLLKGQTLASVQGQGTVTAYVVQKELLKAGLTLKDVTWKAMRPADALVALENGAVNFALLLDPVWGKADPAKIEYAFDYSNDVNGGYFFGPNLLSKKRAVGEAFVRALVRTQRQYLQGNYGENAKVRAALAKDLDEPEDSVRSSASGLTFSADMAVRADMAELIQQTYLSTPGILTYTTPIPDDKVIDRSFLRAAGVDAKPLPAAKK